MNPITLKEVYKQVLEMKVKDLDEALIQAESEEEKKFYVQLYNFQLATQQKEIINQKDFTI
ncbi:MULTISPECIES: hypothetical protein [Lactobacillales]|uniref:hypothetical protein n=1 Tax=Lactobacillales TaxID=186826 RepID=UPI000D22C101|nr:MULTISPECIES: hypothetical protein [Lactobacillales]MBQ6143468.1 hypothetical protein [Clostridia bacterium]MCJ1999275.1 hypothetical protein [Lactococcus paracarnosus]MDM7642671.1 hypothetical protein [Leuconostoc citreum]SPC38712.1 conserved protein of unknown function [Lactococcus piscium]